MLSRISAFHIPGALVAPNLLSFNRIIRYVRRDLRIRAGKGWKCNTVSRINDYQKIAAHGPATPIRFVDRRCGPSRFFLFFSLSPPFPPLYFRRLCSSPPFLSNDMMSIDLLNFRQEIRACRLHAILLADRSRNLSATRCKK